VATTMGPEITMVITEGAKVDKVDKVATMVLVEETITILGLAVMVGAIMTTTKNAFISHVIVSHGLFSILSKSRLPHSSTSIMPYKLCC